MDISCTNQSSLASTTSCQSDPLASTTRLHSGSLASSFPTILMLSETSQYDHKSNASLPCKWLIEFQHCNLAQTQGQLASKCVCVNTEYSVGLLMYEEAKGQEVTPRMVWKLCSLRSLGTCRHSFPDHHAWICRGHSH